MSDTEKTQASDRSPQRDHWAELASQLGATPPEPDTEAPAEQTPEAAGMQTPEAEAAEAAERSATCPKPQPKKDSPQVHAAEVAKSEASRAPVEKPKALRSHRESRSPTDWDLLAEELGIVPRGTQEASARQSDSQAAAIAPLATESSGEGGPSAALDEASPVGPRESTTEAADRFEEAIDLFDEPEQPEPSGSGAFRSEAGEAVASPSAGEAIEAAPETESVPGEPFAAESDSPSTQPAASIQAAEGELAPAEAEQSSLLAQGPPAPAEAAVELPADGTESETLQPSEEAPVAPASVSDTPSEAETPEGEPSTAVQAAPAKRSKRRRKRGGRKKKGAAETFTVEGAQQEQAAEPAGETKATEADVGPAEETHPEKQAATQTQAQSGAKTPKVSHRGIPTWEQAVGLIIAKNMEARPKPKHAEGSSRGRNSGRRK